MSRSGTNFKLAASVRSKGYSGVGQRITGAILLALLIGLGAAPSAFAQQGNLRMGNIYYDLSSYFEIEYNDNINYSNLNRQWDIILRPGIQLTSSYQVSQINTLTFGVGLSYQQYLIHPNLSSYNSFLSVSPNSQLAYTILIRNLTIKIYDAFAYAVDPSNSVAFNSKTGQLVYSISQYPRFTNQIGASFDWNLNKVIPYADIYRLDVFPQQSQFSILRRWEYNLSLGVRVIVSPSVIVGLGGSYTADYYQQNYNNDSTSYFMGPSVSWQANSNWTFSASGGYIFYSFSTGGLNGDSSQPSTLVGSVAVMNHFSSNFDHSINFTRTSSFGYVSNTIAINRIAYQASWRFHPRWTANFWAYYEQGQDSGGPNSENYFKYSVSPGVDYEVNTHLSTYGTYEFTQNTSNIIGRTYTRNRVIVGVRYEF